LPATPPPAACSRRLLTPFAYTCRSAFHRSSATQPALSQQVAPFAFSGANVLRLIWFGEEEDVAFAP